MDLQLILKCSQGIYCSQTMMLFSVVMSNLEIVIGAFSYFWYGQPITAPCRYKNETVH